MNRFRAFATMWTVALLAAGCATNSDAPLIFLQSNTAGISIGASAADQGADFVLGYKGADLAIVPVAIVQNDGNSAQINAKAGSGHTDALSVFGQFQVNSNTNAKTPNVGLGRFFATGQAARRLTEGYRAKLGDRPSVTGATATGDCKTLNPSSDPNNDKAGIADKEKDSTSTVAQGVASKAAGSPVAGQETPKATAKSLVFAEYVTFGFIMSGSATESGASVTLGYKDHDFAVVPSVARQHDGHATPLLGHTGAHSDALSVLGQFGADVKNNQDGNLDVGLGKFFATGLAAKVLADGFAVKLCQEYTAPVSK
jgi:hypothetical protein